MDKIIKISPSAKHYIKSNIKKYKLSEIRLKIKNDGFYGMKYEIQSVGKNYCANCRKYIVDGIPILFCKNNEEYIDGTVIKYNKKINIYNSFANYNNMQDNSFSFFHNY